MRLLGSAVAFLILFLSPLPLAAQREIAPSGGVTIFGTLRDAQTNAGVANAMVEIRHLSGSTVATVFTNPDGGFNASGLANGNYHLLIERNGYERLSQVVDLHRRAGVVTLQLELHRIDLDGAASGGSIVSVRELSIPRKAQDAMQKGLKLLHQESDHEADYERSLTQFRQAIKEYPDYYESYAQMGMAYLNLGDAASSERMLRKSIALSDEQYVDAYCMLASVFTDGQRFAEAESLTRKAIELDVSKD